jgi:hypothetical protein
MKIILTLPPFEIDTDELQGQSRLSEDDMLLWQLEGWLENYKYSLSDFAVVRGKDRIRVFERKYTEAIK